MQAISSDPQARTVTVFSLNRAQTLAAHLAAAEIAPTVLTVVDPLAGPDSLATAFPEARTSVITAVAGATEGQASLHQFSLPGLSSLAPATGLLKQLYPNIRETAVQRVPQRAIAPLLAEIGPSEAVIIDAPGQEAFLIAALAEAGWPDTATRLLLRCAREACFEGGADMEALRQSLEAADFALVETVDEDPDWPVLVFRGDPLRREIRRLNGQLRGLETDHARLARQLEAAQAGLQEQAELRSRERDAARTEEGRLRAALEAEREAAESKVALAARLQMVALNDLQALREKYQAVQDVRNAQEALLRALTPRLQEAAAQVRDLMQHEAPALPVSAVAEEGDILRLEGRKKKKKKDRKAK